MYILTHAHSLFRSCTIDFTAFSLYKFHYFHTYIANYTMRIQQTVGATAENGQTESKIFFVVNHF